MGQTEELRMMSRPDRMDYTPITRGHKLTPSQESNTLSTMSEVSCTTTVSMESGVTEEGKENDRMEEFKEDQENGIRSRSVSEETMNTVVMVAVDNRGDSEKR